ncbi:hypothetical protein SLEP1_g19012 [Rubroshorea leprosula]|nr:hypothetical protein SLEP1_g19012 [Rubroshorea leprosula]
MIFPYFLVQEPDLEPRNLSLSAETQIWSVLPPLCWKSRICSALLPCPPAAMWV